MSTGCPSIWRRLARRSSFLVVVLALACQIGAGGLTPPQAAAAGQASVLDAAMVFCVAGQTKPTQDLPPLRHSLVEPAIMQAGAAALHSPCLPGAGPSLPPMPRARFARAMLPQVRAPPARTEATAYPRGPPILI